MLIFQFGRIASSLMHSPSMRRAFVAVRLAILGAVVLVATLPAQKKNKEEETQTLQIPRELPAAVAGNPRNLTFHVTPLSAKGLLSQQIRDALKALSRLTGGATVLKIRAFVAGSGDLRRVRDIVSEHFTERRQPLPALSLVQGGGLPMEGAQVVLESISAARKEVNPNGIVFISPVAATSANPTDAVAPLTEKSLAGLRQQLATARLQPADMLQVTCFLSSLEHLTASRRLLQTEYPTAAINFVQTQRAPFEALAACEGIARLRVKPAGRLDFLNVDGIPREPGVSHMAVVGTPAIILTGTQISFGYEEKDSRLAFDRLQKALEQSGASIRDVAYAHYYPLAGSIAAQVRKIRGEIFDQAQPPAATLLLFTGLPSMDAGFAVDVVAVK
jgi:enamine deaminase RidA (YjgF/YER057c/UK114 family)